MPIFAARIFWLHPRLIRRNARCRSHSFVSTTHDGSNEIGSRVAKSGHIPALHALVQQIIDKFVSTT